MRRMSVRVVGSSLVFLLAVCPAAGRRVMANDGEPTFFHQGVRAWMGVITLLAEDGDAANKERSEAEAKDGDRERADRDHAGHERTMRGDRGGRDGRGPREWSRDRGPGPRGPASRMHAPPMHGMHGMHGMPGMRGMPSMGPGSATRLDEIAERLARIERKLDAAPRMGNPWSPRPEPGSRPGLMAEAQERMEHARRRFAEMEERIKKLEAEVERLKAGK
jgi:hypothetical protein